MGLFSWLFGKKQAKKEDVKIQDIRSAPPVSLGLTVSASREADTGSLPSPASQTRESSKPDPQPPVHAPRTPAVAGELLGAVMSGANQAILDALKGGKIDSSAAQVLLGAVGTGALQGILGTGGQHPGQVSDPSTPPAPNRAPDAAEGLAPQLVGTWLGGFDPITFLPSGQFIANEGHIRGKYTIDGSRITLYKADGTVWDKQYSFSNGQLRYDYKDLATPSVVLRKLPRQEEERLLAEQEEKEKARAEQERILREKRKEERPADAIDCGQLFMHVLQERMAQVPVGYMRAMQGHAYCEICERAGAAISFFRWDRSTRTGVIFCPGCNFTYGRVE
ncbi:MAG: hypothetical protein JNK93_01165 [Planctomycetia bacterium]|nr:hypothetical protein [Planctomycetia bacterium]